MISLNDVLWMGLKYFLFIFLAAFVIYFVAGIFTYGKPLRNKRNPSWADVVMVLGMGLMHRLIDLFRGKYSSKGRAGHSWLDDQQVLAMVRGMRPDGFETFVAKMFTALGYRTALVGGTGDGGIDIEMTKDGRHHVVQCKKFITRKVDPHDVRDFFGAMGDRHIDGKGFFVTSNIFTLEAERFTEGKPIELVDGGRLVRLIRESGILDGASASKTVVTNQPTENCPSCGRKLVVRTNRQDQGRFLGCSGYPGCRYTKPL